MRKFRADLHLHTVLSPCADPGMSPDQLIDLAIRKGMDIIAVTDHNSTRQCRIVREMAQDSGLLVLNGCEVNSREDVHAICLFEDDYSRNEFQKFLDHSLPEIPNRPDYFGYQVLVDEQNNVTEEIPFYLGNGLNAELELIAGFTHELNGLFIPAHVDRPINSIFSQLGFLPKELHVDALQISKYANETQVRKLYDIPAEISIIKASDAHYPEDIGSACTVFKLNEPTFKEISWALHKKNGRSLTIES
ncbi:PHP domain-containing protein [Gaoshiqia sp. Z1-71]|uniref:PHP domain-containing protein n=1 Tax=Gaoshiqia hydrogeniformans TaxID=3290090 RepID=UPI003BF8A82C